MKKIIFILGVVLLSFNLASAEKSSAEKKVTTLEKLVETLELKIRLLEEASENNPPIFYRCNARSVYTTRHFTATGRTKCEAVSNVIETCRIAGEKCLDLDGLMGCLQTRY